MAANDSSFQSPAERYVQALLERLPGDEVRLYAQRKLGIVGDYRTLSPEQRAGVVAIVNEAAYILASEDISQGNDVPVGTDEVILERMKQAINVATQKTREGRGQ